jgi:hypothetical protein
MRIRIWVLALAPFALIGCADETPPVTTTTTTQEVTTGAPTGAVVTRQVVVPQAPPSVRIEAQTVAPGPGIFGHQVTGDGRAGIMYGCLALGSGRPVPGLFGSQDIG